MNPNTAGDKRQVASRRLLRLVAFAAIVLMCDRVEAGIFAGQTTLHLTQGVPFSGRLGLFELDFCSSRPLTSYVATIMWGDGTTTGGIGTAPVATVTTVSAPLLVTAGRTFVISAAVANANGRPVTAAGPVVLFVDGAAVSTAILDATGTAAFDVSVAATGIHTVMAIYMGDFVGQFASSASVPRIVAAR